VAQTISVAMCSFNGERFISDQITSILNQTVIPSEIVVVDDGSSDRTVEILQQIIKKSEHSSIRISLIRNSDRLGVTSNFEKAISATSGDIIFLSDQDDIWLSDRIETYLNHWESEGPTQLIFSDATLIDAQGKVLQSSLFKGLKVTRREIDFAENGKLFEVLIKRNIVTGATAALSRSLFEIAAPFPKSWLHDEWLAIIAAANGQGRLVRDKSIGYRQHDANVIGLKRRTFNYWLGYLFASRAGRFAELNERNLVLQSKLNQLQSGYVELVNQKAQFDRERTISPQSRLMRIPNVLRNVVNGSYTRFASNGRPEAIRDLTQAS
jgi:glycosyltransferase involved in cell wall biosynthesis